MHRLPRFPHVWLWSLILLTGLPDTTFAEEQFVLQVPGRNDLTSTASVGPRQITITDSQAQTFVYVRSPQMDTADGEYLGYYSQAAGQSLRWPASNAGAMLIGSANGQNWRQSRQQIQAAQAAAPQQPNSVVARRPAFDRAGQNLTPNVPNAGQKPYSGPMEVAYAPAGNQALDVGYIGSQGNLQLYRGFRDEWKPQAVANKQIQNSAGLLPGAPLRLVSNPGQPIPSAYTVDRGGQLMEIRNGSEIRPVANDLQFAPRSNFQVLSTNQGTEGFAVDAQGRLWDLDLAGGRHQLIDQNAGKYSPGAPIAVVSQPGERGPRADLFLVDRTGQIVNYSSAGGQWNGPAGVAAGFPPGAPLTAANLQLGGRNQVRLAGVDVRGQVQTLGQTAVGWQASPVQGAILPPGSPLAFTQAGANFSLSGIGPGGVWQDWDFASGQWNQSVVNRGFLAGAPIVADPVTQSAFGVDATGRLVAGGYWDDAWHSHLLLPDLDYAPALVNRQIIPNQALKPATVYFDNSSPEELVVQMVDLARGKAQFNIPPGGSVPRSIPRDAGGTLQETYLVPGPLGGWVERVDSFPLPAQPGPTMVVWSKRVTYSYIDKKGISVVPDFDLKTHVSLGVFDLPPGAYLQDGDRFDVFAEAAGRRNPGAARWFGIPAPDADVGVPLIRDYGPPPTPNPSENTTSPSPSPVPPSPTSPSPTSPSPTSPSPTSPSQNNSENTPEGPALPPLPR